MENQTFLEEQEEGATCDPKLKESQAGAKPSYMSINATIVCDEKTKTWIWVDPHIA